MFKHSDSYRRFCPGEEQITTNPTFDGFPMWTPDGKKLVFASNRANAKNGETNVFIADWVD